MASGDGEIGARVSVREDGAVGYVASGKGVSGDGERVGGVKVGGSASSTRRYCSTCDHEIRAANQTARVSSQGSQSKGETRLWSPVHPSSGKSRLLSSYPPSCPNILLPCASSLPLLHPGLPHPHTP